MYVNASHMQIQWHVPAHYQRTKRPKMRYEATHMQAAPSHTSTARDRPLKHIYDLTEMTEIQSVTNTASVLILAHLLLKHTQGNLTDQAFF